MTVTPVAFPNLSLAVGAVLLPVAAVEAPPGTCPRLGRDVVVAVPVCSCSASAEVERTFSHVIPAP